MASGGGQSSLLSAIDASIFDCEVLALDKAGFAQALVERAHTIRKGRGAARPGKFGNNRIRIVRSVNQNSRFDPCARKLFFVPSPKIVLQQYRPDSEAPTTGRRVRFQR